MPLIKNLDTLDYAHGGLVFAAWASPPVGSTDTLNSAYGGLPFYSQFDTQALAPAVITISANAVEIVTVNRKFPNKRQEMVGETQIKQVSPAFGAQYVIYLP